MIAAFEEFPFLNTRTNNTIKQINSKNIKIKLGIAPTEKPKSIKFLISKTLDSKKINDNEMGHLISLSLFIIKGIENITNPI
mgnify:CR=1 FL=1